MRQLGRPPVTPYSIGGVAAPKVLVVVAHPVIASGIETLLRLEGDYELRRVASLPEAATMREWEPQVALVDGTLLSGFTEANLGVPAYVLSGSERDGRQPQPVAAREVGGTRDRHGQPSGSCGAAGRRGHECRPM